MLRTIGFGVVALAAMLSTLPVVAQQSACSKTIVFGAIDWPPYIAWKDENTPNGLDIALIDAIFKKAGCRYRVMPLPFKRTLRDIESGRVDGSPLISFTEERARFGHYSLPLRPEIIGAFMVTGDTQDRQPQSFDALVQSGLGMGAVLGGWYGPRFEKALETNPEFRDRLTTFKDFETLFRALEAGIIDVAINDVASGQYMAEQLTEGRNVLLLPFAVHANDVHLFFSRKTVTKADMAHINNAIKVFRTKPTYRNLLRLYLPERLLDLAAQPDE